MTARNIETMIAWYTVCVLVIYLPLETWASMPNGLLNPFYLVDLIGMFIMGWGAVVSLSARPLPAPALLCAGYAWCSANGWRATFDRVVLLDDGGALAHGNWELWIVGGSTLAAVIVFVVLLYLISAASVHANRDTQ